jgi:hypothetical protein
MDKTHIPSDNKREARARFITVDAALHRKPSMGALLREGLQSLFHSPGTLQEDFVILLRRLDAPCQGNPFPRHARFDRSDDAGLFAPT